MRARQRQRWRDAVPLDELAGGLRVPPGMLEAADPAEALHAAEAAETLRAQLARLPETQQAVMRLHFGAGLTTTEIARRLSISEGAVRVRLHRARTALREGLQPTTKEPGDMVDVTVQDVVARVIDEGDTATAAPPDWLRVVLLRDGATDRLLPIWISAADARALAGALAGREARRPLSADLMAHLVAASGTQIQAVSVSALDGDVFHATVVISVAGERHELDARPSDAINLALRVGAPLAVAADVMERAGIAPDALDEHLAEVAFEQAGEAATQAGRWTSLTAELADALENPWRASPHP